MDIRDLTLWYNEAQKKMVTDQIKSIQAVRFGMAEQESHDRVMTKLENSLLELEVGKDTIIKANWDSLREGK